MIFFFQAEDGIRDLTVTGVQTCALPISTPPAPVRSPAPLARAGARSRRPPTRPLRASAAAAGAGRRRRARAVPPLPPARRNRARSEEHTSELQSQSNLVCRLLLEKKKRI